MKNTKLSNHVIVHKKLNPAIENCALKPSSHGGCQMKQVSARPNKLFSMTSHALTNFTPNQPATFMALPMPVIYSRQGPKTVWWKGGDGGVWAVFLNISVLPSPAERNCVIMPDSFYDSNQGYCLCKRPAPLCAAEQPRHYTPAAENESIAMGWGGAGWDSRAEMQSMGRGDNRNVCTLYNHINTIHSLICNSPTVNKKVSLHKIVANANRLQYRSYNLGVLTVFVFLLHQDI